MVKLLPFNFYPILKKRDFRIVLFFEQKIEPILLTQVKGLWSALQPTLT